MVMLSTKVSELDLENFDGQLTQTIILSNISWQTYQTMLAEMGDHRSTRLAYHNGFLSLKMPSKLHEIINRLLARIIQTLTEELELEVVNIGSSTLDRDDLEKGAEPDTGFYIQNASQLEGLDPEIPAHLPPDLVIEVDITSPSTRRIEIYQVLKVPEIWQYTKGEGVVIYQLQTEGYAPCEASLAFPMLTRLELNHFLNQRQLQGENQVIGDIRRWIREHQ